MKLDLVGQRFGKLLVLSYAGTDKHHKTLWVCQCDCGSAPITVVGSNLTKGNSKSCGCVKREHMAQLRAAHRMFGTPEYNTWAGIIQRCTNPNDKAWHNYGGRGIQVCDRWRNSFEAFYEDMGPRPARTSIYRIDNNGHYEPGNCRWADYATQGINRRTTHMIDGKTIKEWAQELGIPYRTALARYTRKGVVTLTK